MSRWCPHCGKPVGVGELRRAPKPPRKAKPRRLLTTPPPENSANAKLWQAMRMMPTFTLSDLRATTEAGRGAAQGFTRALLNSGYVACVRKKKAGQAGALAVFRLARNTGPLAPRLREGAIFDVNLQKEVAHVG